MPGFDSNFDRVSHRLPRAGKTGRVRAAVISGLVHLMAVVVLLMGLAPSTVRYEDYVTIALTPERRTLKETPPVLPNAPPTLIDASEPPPPVVTIAPEASAPPRASASFAFALPPMMLPSPPDSAAGGSNARATWETALLARVAAAKHAPPGKSQGVVLLRFIMDRDGAVLTVRVDRSSGYPVLDQEALAALQRAVPLPRPPAEVPGETLDLIVPVDFYT